MTTNQTVDGVPRDFFELALNLCHLLGIPPAGPRAKELRALLDAPAVERKPFGWWRVPPGLPLQGMFLSYVGPETEAPIRNALDSGFTVIRLYDHPEPATNPHGEPVAIYQAEFLGEGGGGWSDVEHSEYLSLRSSSEFRLRTVYAEQPTPAAVAQKYDDTLVPFVTLMRRELHANAGKGDRPGWLSMPADTCLLEIFYHLGKLQKSVKKSDGDGMMEYAADVANMCMMLLDICGALALVELPPPVAFDIELAAQKLAACMDYPWDQMPEKGRASMRDHAKAIINAAAQPGIKP